jgi:acyl carrier protein
VAFMESDCGIRVEDEELVAENFVTLRSLGDLITRKSESAETSSYRFPKAN